MINRSPRHKSLFTVGLMLAFAAAPLGQALAQEAGASMQKSADNQTVPDKAADAWITTKVKSEFGTTKGISATAITVSTRDGVVTLSGNASTAGEKLHAIRVAKAVKGVKSVDASRLNLAAESKNMPSSDMGGH